MSLNKQRSDRLTAAIKKAISYWCVSRWRLTGIPAHALPVYIRFVRRQWNEILFQAFHKCKRRWAFIITQANCGFLGTTESLLLQSADCLCICVYRLEFYICQQSEKTFCMSSDFILRKTNEQKKFECNWHCVCGCVWVWCLWIRGRICEHVIRYKFMRLCITVTATKYVENSVFASTALSTFLFSLENFERVAGAHFFCFVRDLCAKHYIFWNVTTKWTFFLQLLLHSLIHCHVDAECWHHVSSLYRGMCFVCALARVKIEYKQRHDFYWITDCFRRRLLLLFFAVVCRTSYTYYI